VHAPHLPLLLWRLRHSSSSAWQALRRSHHKGCIGHGRASGSARLCRTARGTGLAQWAAPALAGRGRGSPSPPASGTQMTW